MRPFLPLAKISVSSAAPWLRLTFAFEQQQRKEGRQTNKAKPDKHECPDHARLALSLPLACPHPY
jgi:hypothetical protein